MSDLESILKRIERRLETLETKETPRRVDLTDYLTETAANSLYLGKTATADNSARLGGSAPADFASAGHNHDSTYLGINAKAYDSFRLGGTLASYYARTNALQTWSAKQTFSVYPEVSSTATPTGNQVVTRAKADGLYASKSDVPIYTGWTAWTPTATGWSMINLTRACRFMREGNTVYFNVYVYGTSNSTGASISLPPELPAVNIANLYWRGISAGMNNGAALTTPMMWQISPGGTGILCYSSLAAGGWTASGDKLVAFQGFYETSAT